MQNGGTIIVMSTPYGGGMGSSYKDGFLEINGSRTRIFSARSLYPVSIAQPSAKRIDVTICRGKFFSSRSALSGPELTISYKVTSAC